MKIKMLETRLGAANPVGSRTRLFRRGETYAVVEDWQRTLAEAFIAAGWATRVGGKTGPTSRGRRTVPVSRARGTRQR